MARRTPQNSEESDTHVLVQPGTKDKLERPKLYKVLFHNDHYTTMEFVVAVLKEVFHKSDADAVGIMLQVHRAGLGVAGVYTHDVAATKVRTVENLARANEFPLKLSLEPEEL